MTGWLVGIGVPVAGFLALIGSVWHHKGRNTGRHVAPTGMLARDVTLPVAHLTVPIAHVKDAPPWDDAPEPDPAWVADLRAALDEAEPSGWVKPELDALMAAPTPAGQGNCVMCGRVTPGQVTDLDLPEYICAGKCANLWRAAELRYEAGEWLTTEPAIYGVQFDEQGREVGWLPDPYDMWGAPAGELDLWAAVSASPQTAELAHEHPEPSRLADTTDQLRLDLAMDVAGYMVEQDADATRYGEDLAGWCAGQLRALRETLCHRR